MNTHSSPQYLAHAFHPELPTGRAVGTLSVTSSTIIFTTQTTSVELPIIGLQLQPGGAHQRLILLTHEVLPDWSIYTSDQQLLRDPILLIHTNVYNQIKAIKRTQFKKWGCLTAGLIILGSLGWGSFVLTTTYLPALIANQIPPAWEIQLGESSFADYKKSRKVLEDANLIKEINAMTARLLAKIPESRYPFRVYVMADPTINAFALPGGYIALHTGLILMADTPEEILGVLAHEIAHVTQQHGLRSLIRVTGLYLMAQALIGDVSGLFAVLANAAPLLLNQKYSRDFEREADQLGLTYLVAANINPQGLITFFEKLQQQTSGAPIEKSMILLSTHPATTERITYLRQQLETYPKYNYWRFGKELAHLKKLIVEEKKP